MTRPSCPYSRLSRLRSIWSSLLQTSSRTRCTSTTLSNLCKQADATDTIRISSTDQSHAFTVTLHISSMRILGYRSIRLSSE
ncbi:hypothetical protein AQUCO_02600179v1 [Aquilegia coerulea]|uniref:Uncharacterized protein n=1 Tax=Aquilegia coerulea TaxID=218851 RepID=A0A2G5D7P4_AQUCA|nr:hypothetical protein AQUCO_02600179v1 [Aquilegia coerulea]